MSSGQSDQPRVVFNERTGERIEFLVDRAEILAWNATWTRPGRRAPTHAHPRMEERWLVLEGQAGFEIDGTYREAGPGETVVAPQGSVHAAWNPGDSPVRLRVEMRPGLRWRQFTTRLFSGEDPEVLLREYPGEIVVPGA